jgi:amidohydrolase
MQIKNIISSLASEYFEDIVSLRRTIHQNPELSFEEDNTSHLVQTKLEEWGIPFQSGYAGHGILGIIKGNNPKKKVVALRADMDALPVNEQTDIPFKSKKPGVMHACGHDVHTSTLLGTARILSEIKSQFEGTVLLIFQPAEELIPGGAKPMMDDGLFNEYTPELVIGQHVMPSMEVGTVGFKPGMYMASSDEIYLKVKGEGGHAAMPHLINDTVLIASHIIVALQQVVSRYAMASIPSVLSFGKIIGDGANNVIPSEVSIDGTFRTMNEVWRAEAKQHIRRIASSIAESMGATCDVIIKDGYPFLVNDEHATATAREAAIDFLGEEKVVDMDIRMTAEDFAYFSQLYPSCFFRLGTGNKEQGINAPLHSPFFNVDENAIETGMATMAWLAYSFMES